MHGEWPGAVACLLFRKGLALLKSASADVRGRFADQPSAREEACLSQRATLCFATCAFGGRRPQDPTQRWGTPQACSGCEVLWALGVWRMCFGIPALFGACCVFSCCMMACSARPRQQRREAGDQV